ncbi:MAG TPA: DUF4397 domain-containing protein [Microlunatus sp.]
MSNIPRPRRILAAAGAAALLVGASMTMTNPAYAESTSQISVIHGVPKLTVDVYLDGTRVLNNFKPGTVAGPLSVPSGAHEVAITAGDAKDDSKPVIGPVDVTLRTGENYSAVAHLKANGDPTATLFTNDISKTAAGQGRLTVRHTAAAPAVDVLAGGKPVIQNLSNPDQKVLDLPAGTVETAVAAAGTTKPLIGPAPVKVAEGTNTIVYAWGSAKDNNLKLAVQTISGLHNAPSGIPAGEAGLVAAGSAPWIGAGLLALAAVAVLIIGRAIRPVRLR